MDSHRIPILFQISELLQICLSEEIYQATLPADFLNWSLRNSSLWSWTFEQISVKLISRFRKRLDPLELEYTLFQRCCLGMRYKNNNIVCLKRKIFFGASHSFLSCLALEKLTTLERSSLEEIIIISSDTLEAFWRIILRSVARVKYRTRAEVRRGTVISLKKLIHNYSFPGSNEVTNWK